MCGIAGILKLNGSEVTEQELKCMTDAIVHRGPDGEGQWVSMDKRLGFGHRRLSIIDLSNNGKQPMHYAEGRYTITFNGEIYNYIELKKELISRGYKFHSSSDTEVLLALYDLKKEKCLADLDGMFAFSIWDEQEKTLFCARDRFGEKPFFYHHVAGSFFYFASEMKALWAVEIKKEQDQQMISQFMINSALVDSKDLSRTFYDTIRQLDSAHYIIIKNNQVNVVRYYDLNNIAINTQISKQEASEKFLSLLTNSIRLRLRSDVPVGSSLSGGLDSSSIVMLIDQLKGNVINQNTFSARFSDFAKDEGKYIQTVIDACKNVSPHKVWPTGDQMITELDKVVYHQEEPFGSASIFAQWKVMQLAKQNHVTVLLDGQGADEYLAGYLPYYNLYLQQLFHSNKKMYEKEWLTYKNLRPKALSRVEDTETLRMTVGRIGRKILNRPIPYYNGLLKRELNRHMMLDGLKILLRYADRNAMAHSREVRLPFLSHHLVEFVFSLPDEYLLYEGWTKWIMRDAMKNILPSEICWRVDKIGYEPPQQAWLKSEFVQEKIRNVKKEFNQKMIASGGYTNDQDWRCLMYAYYFQ
jgi:asparagine synthase (glutamine-hydrolysing)